MSQPTPSIAGAVILTLVPFTACRQASLVESPGPKETAKSQELKALFQDPPRRYSSGPLWVWNDMLTEEQITSTMQDLARQNVKQVFVHPRPGLMTPYLSDRWFELWQVALAQAERLDMNVWIYDENSYPSGFAGGLVPELMPQSRGKGLVLTQQDHPPTRLSENMVAVYMPDSNCYYDVTDRIRAGQEMPKADYLVASIRYASTSGWYGGRFYVNLLDKGVTEKFLDVTMTGYLQHIGEQFGRRVPGVFTDEPHIRPAGGFPWASDLPALFHKRWGYNLLDVLPCLLKEVGDYKRVRHNYYQLLLELFIERWGKPYYEFCNRHHLEFTGHYWEHEWPNCLRSPDNMAMYAWHQRPAIDTLMNRYSEDTHAQFGNVRAVKELSSVANQLGRKRTLCEAYGAGGWDLRFEDAKRIGDWLYALGVNTLNQHLSYITIRGARKRDHPQSFSYHEPWWQDYHVLASYFSRLSAALSAGRQINSILLIEPTTTAWMYQVDPSATGHLKKIGDEFQSLVVRLAKKQVEFDLGSEYIIGRWGSAGRRSFEIGRRSYRTVILPALTENLNSKTARLLEAYARSGGKVICCGPPPSLVDGRPSELLLKAARYPSWRRVDAAEVPAVLPNPPDGFLILQNDPNQGILLHNRRKLKDGNLLFAVNTSIEAGCSATVVCPAKSAQLWDPETGDILPYPFKASSTGITLTFELQPCGSILLFLSDRPQNTPPPEAAAGESVIPATGNLAITRIAQNVLTLDYVDITAGGESKQNIYCYRANQFAFQKNGMAVNPWDSSVQFRDELISRQFPADSGFEATYHFSIEGSVPDPLYIVIERPDLYEITCNGTPVSAKKGSWWLDKAFGKIEITKSAKTGLNAVTIKACPMTIYHELEPAYVLGDFALKPTDSGYVIAPDVPLRVGPWNKQGHPFYAAGVSYTQRFSLAQPTGRYYVRLPKWYGSIARVTVNGKPAGHIYHQPWQCEVTGYIRPGTNTIEVVAVGTLKNTLGPHHGNPPLGSAWPAAFRRGPEQGPPPGQKYHTVGYGLFEAFELVNR